MQPELLNGIRADLSGYSFADYLRQIKAVEAAAAGAPPLRVAILRSYTSEPIEPVLRVRLAVEGFAPAFWFGGFNQYVQEVLDQDGGLHQFRPDVILLMLRLEEVLPDFVEEFSSRTVAEWEDRIAAKARDLGALAERIRATMPAHILVQNMTLARGAFFGAFDSQRPDGQIHLLNRFNQQLADAIARVPGAFLWDFDGFVRDKGAENLYDPKMWYVSRNPYKQAWYPAIGADVMRYLRSALGRVKKCIVVDLDNTLWGGLAGEDGIDGIQLGHSYPGNCFRDFQRELLKLRERGILLAINSKNNEGDALRILDEHPDMVLRRPHFAAMRINWRDKASNLRDLARELNIGVDSMIFVDDNPAECELVRQGCPGCEVIALPDKPYLLPALPASFSGVENVGLTDEDRRKAEMYRAQSARRGHQEEYSNLDEFLCSLEIEVSIEPASPFSIPRIAQLTQKTNQMNMTTRRYTEAHIQSMAHNPSCAVFSVASKDRFGDEGITGVVILRFDGEACAIDTFLLSCRVIGRGVERLMLAVAADYARSRGIRWLEAEFVPTPRNQPASGFYEKNGFQRISDNLFRADLSAAAFVCPTHIRLSAPTGVAAVGRCPSPC